MKKDFKDKLLIDIGAYGPRATLVSKWSKDIFNFILDNNIVELELNDAKGWSGENLLFLKDFLFLKSFTIIDLKIKDISSIHNFINLKKVEIITYCETNIDFSFFPYLEDCGLEWINGSSSIFKCKALRNLYLNCYPESDTNEFSGLENLENLSILNSPVENLKGLSSLKKLKNLRLGNLKKLTCLDGIQHLKNLEVLEVQACKNIRLINEINNLKGLKKVSLNEMGRIESLLPLSGICGIEELFFYGSTNILDGNLSFIMLFNKLKKISFQNRRHYSHKRENFM